MNKEKIRNYLDDTARFLTRVQEVADRLDYVWHKEYDTWHYNPEREIIELQWIEEDAGDRCEGTVPLVFLWDDKAIEAWLEEKERERRAEDEAYQSKVEYQRQQRIKELQREFAQLTGEAT